MQPIYFHSSHLLYMPMKAQRGKSSEDSFSSLCGCPKLPTLCVSAYSTVLMDWTDQKSQSSVSPLVPCNWRNPANSMISPSFATDTKRETRLTQVTWIIWGGSWDCAKLTMGRSGEGPQVGKKEDQEGPRRNKLLLCKQGSDWALRLFQGLIPAFGLLCNLHCCPVLNVLNVCEVSFLSGISFTLNSH